MAATILSPLVFIGTYTGDRAKGVYCYRFDGETGALEYVDSFAVGPNPSFLELHPHAHVLYVVNEAMTWEGQAAGGVTACTYHPFTGRVTLLNSQSSAGTGPATWPWIPAAVSPWWPITWAAASAPCPSPPAAPGAGQ
jgi:6-phosphogluconolactonase (cycloisomerase 2 family)